ncbi:MAG: M28 family peptidase [Planctomycetota bacterium]|nr:M28 family peptidase [Planctomycetota bacterium]
MTSTLCRRTSTTLFALAAAACATGSAAETSLPFDEARAWAHLEKIVAFGPRPAGSTKLDRLRDYLKVELEKLGLEPVIEEFLDMTPNGEVRFANLYADIPARAKDGAEPPIVVLCTHIDTKRLPFHFVGANDGGSGTAVLLELARCLVGADEPTGITYRILFLDGEEAFGPVWKDPDNRYGSRYHVKRLQETGVISRVKACILLDLVGDVDLRLQRDLNSDQALLSIFFEAARAAGMEREVSGGRNEIKDDHLSFLSAGIPSVDLIDLEYGPYNKWWHTAEDTLERCSRKSLGAAGRIVLLGLPAVERLLTGS